MTEPHGAEASATGTLSAVAAEKLGATAGLVGLLGWHSGGQDGGHLAPDLAPYLGSFYSFTKKRNGNDFFLNV